MAKTLIVGINGSPRKNGRTAGLLKKILQTAKNSGGETKLLHLVDYEIKPCLGCYSTDFKKCIYPCRIKDGMQKIYPLLEKADALVLGSPVYWFNMSGLMKNFIDRLCCAENNGFLYQGKIAALAVSKEDGGEMMAEEHPAAGGHEIAAVVEPLRGRRAPVEILQNGGEVRGDVAGADAIVSQCVVQFLDMPTQSRREIRLAAHVEDRQRRQRSPAQGGGESEQARQPVPRGEIHFDHRIRALAQGGGRTFEITLAAMGSGIVPRRAVVVKSHRHARIIARN